MRLLYIAHRIPWPPDKGDKIRSYNELTFLCRHYQVDLVFFYGSEKERRHFEKLGAICASVSGFRRGPWNQLFRAVEGVLRREPLSVSLYRHRGMRRRIAELVAEHRYRNIFIFSGQMVQYLAPEDMPRTVVDFCDVDSHKWRNYSERLPFYASWFYRMEAGRLLAFEKAASRAAKAAVFITRSELDLYRSLGGEGRFAVIGNGVDTEYFRPSGEAWEEGRILFTGAMDYFPNEEGVSWFAREVFPGLKAAFPAARFVIAGSNPSLKVRALERIDGVEVTGFVPDMRVEQARAHVVVVPLRIARGMQNKVLEAMACGKATVVQPTAMGGIEAEHGKEIFVADSAEDFRRCLESLLRNPALVAEVGRAAREHIVAHYSWDRNLTKGLLPLIGPPSKTQAIQEAENPSRKA